MKAVDLKELSKHWRKYVELATSGETILIRNHDQLVARLGPANETRNPIFDDPFLVEDVRSGNLTPSVRTGAPPPPRAAPVAGLGEVLAELDESRRER